MDARLTQRRLLLCALAILALASVASACGGGSDVQAAPKEPPLAQYTGSGLSFSYPAAWTAAKPVLPTVAPALQPARLPEHAAGARSLLDEGEHDELRIPHRPPPARRCADHLGDERAARDGARARHTDSRSAATPPPARRRRAENVAPSAPTGRSTSRSQRTPCRRPSPTSLRACAGRAWPKPSRASTRCSRRRPSPRSNRALRRHRRRLRRIGGRPSVAAASPRSCDLRVELADLRHPRVEARSARSHRSRPARTRVLPSSP